VLEIERNRPVEPGVLSEFFARCGWQDPEAAAKLGWVLAASEEWVVCKLDGELIGFGRSCRMDPIKRVALDVLVDPRFEETGLGGALVHLLTEQMGSVEAASLCGARPAPPDAYLGKPRVGEPAWRRPPAPRDAATGEAGGAAATQAGVASAPQADGATAP
jgi:hypothetical protein